MFDHPVFDRLAGRLSDLSADALLVARGLASRRAKAPFKLTIAVTWACEQRCTHCRIWRRPRSSELSCGQWRQVFRHGRGHLSWIDLTGGEVTRREDFAELALAALEELPQLALLHYPSNGARPERLEAVTRAILGGQPRRLIVSLSLDGPPTLHNRLRGDKEAFGHVMDSYRRLRALGVEVYFGMTLSAWNLDRLDQTYQAITGHFPGFRWRDLHVNFLHESPHFFQNEGIRPVDPDALADTIQRLIARRGLPRHQTHLLEHLYLSGVATHLQTGRSPVACGAMAGHCFIDPEGTVYPCHIWDAPVGQLRQHQWSLRRLFSSAEAQARRAAVIRDACPGCWTPCDAYPTILGQLPSAAGVALSQH